MKDNWYVMKIPFNYVSSGLEGLLLAVTTKSFWDFSSVKDQHFIILYDFIYPALCCVQVEKVQDLCVCNLTS